MKRWQIGVMAVSFLASVTLLPASLVMFRPKFLTRGMG